MDIPSENVDLIKKGIKFSIYALEIQGRNLFKELMVELTPKKKETKQFGEPELTRQKKKIKEKKSGLNGAALISATIERIADQGVPHNKKIFRILFDGIYEIKLLSLNLRIYCAFQGKRVIVISHGTLKLKPKKLAIEVALARNRILEGGGKL